MYRPAIFGRVARLSSGRALLEAESPHMRVDASVQGGTSLVERFSLRLLLRVIGARLLE